MALTPEERREKKRLTVAAYRAELGPELLAQRRANVPIDDLSHAQWLETQVSQNHCCVYCDTPHKGHLTQDHITPFEDQGSHTLFNVVAACRSCNSIKGTGPPLCQVQPLLFTLAKPKKDTGALARARRLAH